MAASRKCSDERYVYRYLTRVRVMLIADAAILLALIPVSFLDKAAWIGGVPVISIVLVPAVLYFSWIIWQDTRQKITLIKDSVVWETGAWRWRKTVEIPFAEIGQMRDETTLFSVSRKYALVSAVSPATRIRLNSSLERYRDLLRLIVKRVPKGSISERAAKSLQHIHVLGN